MTRVNCCVPFCGRGRGDRKNDPVTPGMEYLCENHFRLVDKDLKTLRTKARRKHGRSERGWRFDCLIWRRMKRQAIERGAGI